MIHGYKINEFSRYQNKYVKYFCFINSLGNTSFIEIIEVCLIKIL